MEADGRGFEPRETERIYWPPLYAFLRHRGYSSADAQDLVQGFFAFLLAEKTLSRADRERGFSSQSFWKRGSFGSGSNIGFEPKGAQE
jgi:hypothetical protein